MRIIAWQLRLLAVGGAVLLLGACDVDQTEEGELPEVTVEEGELPEYDVDAAEVEVGTDEDTVIVETPEVDIEAPEADDAETRDD